MKKIISLLICIVLFASLMPLHVSAADSADFKIAVISQNDKTVSITFDFVSGTAFSAFDFQIKYNDVKLTLDKCEKGEGFKDFQKYLIEKSETIISSVNSDSNPIKGSMASIEGFKIINKSGSILKMTFTKVPGTKLTKTDIEVKISNCQTASFTNIKTTVTTDLTEQQNQTQGEGENSSNPSQGVSADDVEQNQGNNQQNQTNDDKEQNEAQNNGSDNNQPEQAENEQKESNKDESSSKKIIIIIAAVACAAGVGAVIIVFIKNSKKPENKI